MKKAPVLFSYEESEGATYRNWQVAERKLDERTNKNFQYTERNLKHIQISEKETVFVTSYNGSQNTAQNGTSVTDDRTKNLRDVKSNLVQERERKKHYKFAGSQQKQYQTNIRRKSVHKSVLSNKESILNIIIGFCLTSTIDALQYVVGKHCKFIWRAVFTIVTMYSIYQCKLNLDTYFSYNLSTKVTEQPRSTFNFPAITFCPMRMHKKSTYGSQPFLDLSLSSYYANSILEINSLMPENERSCNNHNNLTEKMKSNEIVIFNDLVMNGSIWITNKYFINYQDVLLQCIWNKKQIDCSDAFMNHISDVGACFTFNPGEQLASFTVDTKTGYGINLTSYNENRYTSSLGSQGLKLFLNIQQSEYCGNEATKRGAGLFFQVHGTNRNPSFIINPSTYISPGYDIKVFMDPIVYKRKTAQLGRCASNVPLYLLFNVDTVEYVLEHCYMQCATEYIIKACKCYPPNLGAFHDALLTKTDYLGVAISSIKVCLGPDYVCLREWIHFNMSVTAMTILCPYCKQPCEETKYSTQMVNLLLSPQNMQIPVFNNVSFNDLHKNNFIVNFILKTTEVQLIIEEQAFTLQDLFIYIGNNIGLCLGMSFTTSFELLYFISELVVAFGKRNK